jgi:DNA-directed RNA polymerase subunit L
LVFLLVLYFLLFNLLTYILLPLPFVSLFSYTIEHLVIVDLYTLCKWSINAAPKVRNGVGILSDAISNGVEVVPALYYGITALCLLEGSTK